MADPSSRTPQYHCQQIYMRGMKYTNKKKKSNIKEILKVYIINSITKSYILNIKIRPLVFEYTLMIKLVDGTSSTHSFNPEAYFGHSWSYFDIQNLRLVILYIFFFSGSVLQTIVCLVFPFCSSSSISDYPFAIFKLFSICMFFKYQISNSILCFILYQ